MTTRMIDLSETAKAAEIFFIGRGNPDNLQSLQPALIDKQLNSTGRDLALFFSTEDKAVAYRNHFLSLRGLNIYRASIYEMIKIFDGKVEYFTVDNVPEG